MLNLLVRVSSLPEKGLGHLSRCLGLSRHIMELNPDSRIKFLLDENPAIYSMVRKAGFSYLIRKEQSEEEYLESAIQKSDGQVLLIDNLYDYSRELIANIRRHLKVVILHNYCSGADQADAYIFPLAHAEQSLIDDPKWQQGKVKVFSGYDYILLSDEVRKFKRLPTSSRKSMIVTTGGTDPAGVLLKILDWLNNFTELTGPINVLVGQSFQHRDELFEMKKHLREGINLIPFDPEYMRHASMAICTFGVTTYELLYLGIPVLSIGHSAQNAKGSNILAEKNNFIISAGYIGDLDENKFRKYMERILELANRSDLHSPIDGLGVSRIAELIFSLSIEKKNEVSYSK